jgi:hypothetical protein
MQLQKKKKKKKTNTEKGRSNGSNDTALAKQV